MKNFFYIILLLIGMSFFSCQDEDDKKSYSATETLSVDSPLTQTITQVVQNPTVFDNIIDNSSGFSVQLPVTFTVDMQQVTVNTAGDFTSVTNIKEQSVSDDDIIHFQFPITIVYPDYHTMVVTSQQQYNAAVSNCEGQEPTGLECIHFNFPIVINTYNSGSQVPGSVNVTSSSQLYAFIGNCESSTVFSIVYPITMTNASGQQLVISNNTELNAAIAASIGTCNNTTASDLAATLKTGSWHVSSFIDDDNNYTVNFSGYNFTFAASGTATAVKAAVTINGSWNIGNNGGIQKLNLHFDGNTLNELEEDWQVLGFTATQIQMKHQGGSGGDMHYLTFARN